MLKDDSVFDVLVVGGGLAGLMTTLGLASRYRVALITKEALLESNTRYAQGGIAAVMDIARVGSPW